eukprot:8029198-Ditylum_brightwellii.AAC.1
MKKDLWVWCALSHPNQTCRDKAVWELNSWLCIEGTVELNQYLTKGVKDKKSKSTCTTRSLVVAGREDDKDEGIEQLLLFNNLSPEVKDQYPCTGHCFFVPFHPTGVITQQMILGMMENQSFFLNNWVNIAIQGFNNIKTMVEDTDVSPANA